MIRLIKENAVTDLRNILKNEVDFSSYPIADKKTGDFERTWKKGSRSMYGYRGKFIEKDEKTVDALMKWLSDILLDKYLGFNLNDLKFKYIIELHPLNILLIVFIFDVLKLERSKYFRLVLL